jgi:homogentisate 1,2-dioxygenase
MPFYVRRGSVPTKRHIQFRRSDGALYADEEISTKGFESVFSLLYHHRPPTAVLSVHSWDDGIAGRSSASNEPLRNRHFATTRLGAPGDAISARVPVLENEDITIAVAAVERPMAYFYRNVGGDELLFVHEGEGRLESAFGIITYRPHDYLVVPSGAVYRLQPSSPTRLLVYECEGAVRIPRKFRNESGQFVEGAPYCERDFRAPELGEPITETGEFEVRVRARGRYTVHVVQNHPFDVVGWDGYCYPYAFNVDEYAPVTGALHQPPPAHQTFEAPGAAFCAFVPRLFDYHPLAIPIPYNHSSVDCDEVIYYVEGDFMSRRGVGKGSITLHPAGATHGPQPGKVEASIGKKVADEVAVMVDTFKPLRVCEGALSVEDAEYYRSWAVPAPGI